LVDAIQLAVNPLAEQFVVMYRNSKPWFPPINSAGLSKSGSGRIFNITLLEKLREAEQYEYVQNRYQNAISIYQNLIELTNEKNDQAQFLNHIARNQIKMNDYTRAITSYQKIISDYPGTITTSGIPLSISAGMELGQCYQKTGNEDGAIQADLDAFRIVLTSWGILTIDQFNTYAIAIQESFNTLLKAFPEDKSENEEYNKEFERLNTDYKDKIAKWKVINMLKDECIPDMSKELQISMAELFMEIPMNPRI